MVLYNMEKTKRLWSNQAQLGLDNLCIKVNTRSWYSESDLSLLKNTLDGDVLIVSIDGKLVHRLVLNLLVCL